MGILAKIRRALQMHEVSALKKNIARLDIQAPKQGKTVESLTIELYTLSGSLSNRFQFNLSDGTANKLRSEITGKNKAKNPSRVAPVQESESESLWVEDYDEAGVEAFVFVRRDDGMRDVLKVGGGQMSVAQAAIWWIETEEKVCQKKSLYDVPSNSKGPLISFSVKMISKI